MDVRQVSVVSLIEGCRRETERFMQHVSFREEPCFELFRRAVVLRDQRAWQGIFDQYRSLTLAWVRLHPAAAVIGEDEEYWINRAFERFWVAVPPERFAAFAGLAPLLRYLKLCVHTSLVDALRARRGAEADTLSERTQDTAPDVASDTVNEMSRDALWQAILDETQSESERHIAYLCLVLDMKPREIVSRFPEQYASAAEVYRIKRNLLDRLARNPRIRRFAE